MRGIRNIAISSDKKIYASLLLVSLIWGWTFVAGKIVAAEVPPYGASLWRFIVALAFLAPVTARSREGLWPKNFTKGDWLVILLLGVTGMAAYNIFMIKGLALADAGRSSVIVATNPSLVVLGSALFFGDRLTTKRVLGVCAAFGGVLTAISHGHISAIFSGDVGLGELYIFGCAVAWASYALLGRRILSKTTALVSTTWATVAGIILIAPVALIYEDPLGFINYSLAAWMGLIFLGVLSTGLAFTLFYLSIKHLGGPKTVIFVNLTPIFGLVAGHVWFGEPLDWSLVAGLALILTGIRLVNK